MGEYHEDREMSFQFQRGKRLVCHRQNSFPIRRSEGIPLFDARADEVKDVGGEALAAEIDAVSAEHPLATGDKNLAARTKAGVIAVLLPANAYSLGKASARVRKMIEIGQSLSLATGCNPGSSLTS